MPDPTTPTKRLVPVEDKRFDNLRDAVAAWHAIQPLGNMATEAQRLERFNAVAAAQIDLMAAANPHVLQDLLLTLDELRAASPAPQELPPVQLPEPAFRAINCAEGYAHGPIWVVVPPQAKPGPLTEHDCYTADQLRAAIAADRRAGGR